MSIWRERHQSGIGIDELDTARCELQIAHEGRSERAERMRERRASKSRGDFLSDYCTADDRASLEDERLQPRFGEVEGGGQAVVTGADDDDWISLPIYRHASLSGFSSRRFVLAHP